MTKRFDDELPPLLLGRIEPLGRANPVAQLPTAKPAIRPAADEPPAVGAV